MKILRGVFPCDEKEASNKRSMSNELRLTMLIRSKDSGTALRTPRFKKDKKDKTHDCSRPSETKRRRLDENLFPRARRDDKSRSPLNWPLFTPQRQRTNPSWAQVGGAGGCYTCDTYTWKCAFF